MPAPTQRVALGVRQATPDDLDTIVDLLRQAYDWLIDSGITDQWVRPFPPEAITPLIDRGEVYLATHNDQPIATFTLTYTPDPELWNHPPDDAGYLRRLAVDRAHAGHGIGAQLLDHAGQLVSRHRPPLAPARLRQAQHETARLLPRPRLHAPAHHRPTPPRIRRAFRALRGTYAPASKPQRPG